MIAAIGADAAIVVGHDWGSGIATTSALVRPDLVRAVGMLSVPYAPRGGPRPTEIFAHIGGPEEFYVSYFQEPGRAEAEIEPDVRTWLAGFYAALAGEAEPPPDGGSVSFVAQGGRLRDRFPDPGPLPAWLSEDDLDVYAGEFERTGFTGALNRYRNMDRDWEDLAELGRRADRAAVDLHRGRARPHAGMDGRRDRGLRHDAPGPRRDPMSWTARDTGSSRSVPPR